MERWGWQVSSERYLFDLWTWKLWSTTAAPGQSPSARPPPAHHPPSARTLPPASSRWRSSLPCITFSRRRLPSHCPPGSLFFLLLCVRRSSPDRGSAYLRFCPPVQRRGAVPRLRALLPRKTRRPGRGTKKFPSSLPTPTSTPRRPSPTFARTIARPQSGSLPIGGRPPLDLLRRL